MNYKELKIHKATNLVHTIGLILSLAGLLGMIGWMIAGYSGAKLALIAAAVSFVFAPRLPVHLLMKTYRARRIHASAMPQLHSITQALSKRANLKKSPALYYIPTNGLNAFAAGTRDDSAIGITHGLLTILNPRQMAGIIGHEISHIKNNDMQVMWTANLFSRLTRYGSLIGQILFLLSIPMLWVSDIHIPLVPLLLLVFSPTISYLLNLALSRTREFEADLGSAVLTGNPRYLASALTTLERHRKSRTGNFFISTPMNQPNDFFSTHPNSGDRINRLMNLTSDTRVNRPGNTVLNHWVGHSNGPETSFHHML